MPTTDEQGQDGPDLEGFSLDELADRANRLSNAEGKTPEHAIRAGEHLIEVKSRLDHGEWIPWLEENFDGSPNTARLYMRFGRNKGEIKRYLYHHPDISIRGADRLLRKNERLDGDQIARMHEDKIYVISARGTDFYKIGQTSANVQTRFDELQTGCPYKLEIELKMPGGEDVERRLHQHFADQRHRGEWFEFQQLPRQQIRAIVENEMSLSEQMMRSLVDGETWGVGGGLFGVLLEDGEIEPISQEDTGSDDG